VNPSPLCKPQDSLDFFDGWRIANVQHQFISDDLTLTSEVASLDVVDCLSHVPVSDKEKRLEGLLSYLHVFPLHDPLQIELDFIVLQLPESQDDAPTLDGLDDLRGGVAGQHEASGLAEIADDHPQCVLGAFSQTVCLIEHNDFGASWR
jgi:hypothetical protein